jgi:hypothetical protein
MLDQHHLNRDRNAVNLQNPNQHNLGSEQNMNTIANQVEDNVQPAAAHLEQPIAIEAIQELSSVELAYIGGGQVTVSFV